MKIRTIVIDDEYLNREVISILVKNANVNFEIVGQAENIDEAYRLISECKPDLIFLDIKMPGGNGFELLSRFDNPNFEVVFITGFDEYALQAFNFNALDYVLKPIDTDKLKNTLRKVYTRINSKISIDNNLKDVLAMYSVDNHFISKIPVHCHDKVELLEIANILSIKAVEGCTVFKILNSNELVSSKQFSSFEFLLGKFSYFIKIAKGVYINVNYIKNYSKGTECTITMKNNDTYEVSRRKKSEILSLLELIG